MQLFSLTIAKRFQVGYPSRWLPAGGKWTRQQHGMHNVNILKLNNTVQQATTASLNSDEICQEVCPFVRMQWALFLRAVEWCGYLKLKTDNVSGDDTR